MQYRLGMPVDPGILAGMGLKIAAVELRKALEAR
jgi:hypothetical protein